MLGVERRSLVLTEAERKLTAYHEAGHAIVALKIPGSDPVHKVTIVPRGRALGLTASLPEVDRHNYSKDWLIGSLAMFFGGRVAEEIIFGADKVTTGAGNDIERATGARPPHGHPVRHERAHRPARRGRQGAGDLPGPRVRPAAGDQRAHRPDGGRRGEAPGGRGLRARHAASSPRTASCSTGSPTRCSSARRSTARTSTGWSRTCPLPPAHPAAGRLAGAAGQRSDEARRVAGSRTSSGHAAGRTRRRVTVTPLALHSPRAVRDTLRAHGWDDGQAAAAAGGIHPLAFHLTGLDQDALEALVRLSGTLGLEVLTGDGWAVLVGQPLAVERASPGRGSCRPRSRSWRSTSASPCRPSRPPSGRRPAATWRSTARC